MGETPHSFIMRRRLASARMMMLTTDKSLGEIALASGFADQAHFSNRFRSAMAISPALWRKREYEAQYKNQTYSQQRSNACQNATERLVQKSVG